MKPGSPASTTLDSAETAARRRTGWLRRLRKAAWYRRSKLLAKRIAGHEPWLAIDARLPLRRYGDWAFVPARLKPGDIVYAFGVGTGLGLELALVNEFGAQVHVFDPSPESTRWVATQHLPPGLTFHAIAIGEHDGKLVLKAREYESRGAPVMYSAVDATRTGPVVEVESLRLHTVKRHLGHDYVSLLKLDVEGAEFGALRSMLADGVRPGQLLVEFHHRFPGVGPACTVAAVTALRESGYRLAFIGEAGREFTFVRDA